MTDEEWKVLEDYAKEHKNTSKINYSNIALACIIAFFFIVIFSLCSKADCIAVITQDNWRYLSPNKLVLVNENEDPVAQVELADCIVNVGEDISTGAMICEGSMVIIGDDSCTVSVVKKLTDDD